MLPARTRALLHTGGALLLVACGRNATRSQEKAAAPSAIASAARAPNLRVARVEPTRLLELSLSAYSTTLVLDDDATYLLSPQRAFRLVPGEPAHGIELALGNGATMTRSAFVFWSEGRVWKAPKTGGSAHAVARLAQSPQYFVASGEAFAWVSLG